MLAALKNTKLTGPRLEDYRGDLQMHSTWSDGSQSLEDIIEAGIARGYDYCAVTDHSYGLKIAGGVSMEELAQQHVEIDRLNRKHRGRFRLLKGIEANIRADGSVDMEPHELATLEIVVAAPHSALRVSGDQTARMVNAVKTRGVHILGHPRGRKYGSRPGVTADWEKVFKAAKRSGVAIEIDGDPSRQDLDYDLARGAVAAGCIVRARQRRAFDRRAALRGNRDRARAARRRARRSHHQLLAARAAARVGEGAVRLTMRIGGLRIADCGLIARISLRVIQDESEMNPKSTINPQSAIRNPQCQCATRTRRTPAARTVAPHLMSRTGFAFGFDSNDTQR